MKPSFGPVNDCLSKRFLKGQIPQDSLTQQGPLDFGTTQNTGGAAWPAHSLPSHNIDDPLHSF